MLRTSVTIPGPNPHCHDTNTTPSKETTYIWSWVTAGSIAAPNQEREHPGQHRDDVILQSSRCRSENLGVFHFLRHLRGGQILGRSHDPGDDWNQRQDRRP